MEAAAERGDFGGWRSCRWPGFPSGSGMDATGLPCVGPPGAGAAPALPGWGLYERRPGQRREAGGLWQRRDVVFYLPRVHRTAACPWPEGDWTPTPVPPTETPWLSSFFPRPAPHGATGGGSASAAATPIEALPRLPPRSLGEWDGSRSEAVLHDGPAHQLSTCVDGWTDRQHTPPGKNSCLRQPVLGRKEVKQHQGWPPVLERWGGQTGHSHPQGEGPNALR